ncbi:MAG: dTDP-4-dehydrorhamnose reductase [Dysgonamonadaceae bacterium]|jgi:dTDP-4-dehydrorhamnose reductase|nr:dTDP-4-dehydrorhamnose reductase [Dysgonamonadaceae bacterium]
MAIFTGSNKHLGGTEHAGGKEQIFYGLVQINVLVTGGYGQLGNELKLRSEQTNSAFRFIFTDADTLDITDRQQVEAFVEQHSIRYIVNCAAYTAVDKAESDEELCYKINCTGPENLAVAATKNGCRLIHVSTDYVFDGEGTKPYRESDATNPQSVYGRTKLQGEQAILKAAPDAVIVRTAWLYSTFGKNFVKTMLQLMHDRPDLNIVADQRGTPTYAADLAEMIVHIMEEAERQEWKPGVYHFTNQGETTWFGFAEKIKAMAKMDSCTLRPVNTAEYKTAAKRPAYSVLDKTKIELAFHVVIPQWEDGLKRCLEKLK